MRAQETFFRKNLTRTRGHSSYIVYFNALQTIREEAAAVRERFRRPFPIAQFACGPEPSTGENPARVAHALGGFPTRFAQIDYGNVIRAHAKDARSKKGSLGVKLSNAYVQASIFGLKPGAVSRALGLKKGTKAPFGLSVALLDYYELEDKKELISRMLEHCDSLVCHVRIGKPPVRSADSIPLKLFPFASVEELKRRLVHEDWRVERVSKLGISSRCTEHDYLLLITHKSKGPTQGRRNRG